MADVRLTATNPEDSSVVPVACNAKGELLLESPESSGGGIQPDDGGTRQTIESTGLSFSDGTTDRVIVDAAGSVYINSSDGGSIQLNATKSVQSSFNGRVDVGSDGDAVAGTAMYVVADSNQSYDAAINIRNLGTAPLLVCRNAAGAEVAGIANDGKFASGAPFASFGSLATHPARFSSDGPDTNTSTYHFEGKVNGVQNCNINTLGGAVFTKEVTVGSRNQQWVITESNGIAHLVAASEYHVSEDVKAQSTFPPLRDLPAEIDSLRKNLQYVMDVMAMTPVDGDDLGDPNS